LQMNLKLLLLNDDFCSVGGFLKHYSVKVNCFFLLCFL